MPAPFKSWLFVMLLKVLAKLKFGIIIIFLLCGHLFVDFLHAPFVQASTDVVISLPGGGVDRAHSLAYSQDGNYLAAGATSGVYIYKSSSNELIKVLETASWARSLAFSPDGFWLAAGLFDHSIQLYSVPKFELVSTLTGHSAWVRQVAFTPDANSLLSISDDGSMKVWQVDKGTLLRSYVVGELEPRTFALSPAGDQLAIGQRDGSIHLYSFPDYSFQRILSEHNDWVRCLAYSPDGSLLASGAFDKQVLVWDPNEGDLVQTLKDHTSSVLGLAFSADGSLLASASVDQTTRLWHMPDGKLVSVLVGHTDFVYAVAFTLDGENLASGSGDNTIRLWDVQKVSEEADDQGIYPGGEQPPQISSDCRECHHARGEVFPPRVIEMRCDTCHTHGAGMNWCVLFPLTPEAKAAGISYKVNSKYSGVPVDGDGLAIRIASPSNGDGLFTNQEFMAPVNISGRVFTDIHSLEETVVQLEAWSGSVRVTNITIPVAASGSFRFRVVINPDGSQPISGKGGDHECNVCHDDFDPMGSLPSGDVLLQVTAKTSDGRQAIDERWISVDSSGRASLKVHVRDMDTGQALEGIPVRASALIYNWRMVYASRNTEPDGSAEFSLDALTENETIYQILVPEVVLDGILYQGLDPVEVSIPAGETNVKDVDLFVHRKKGSLSGQVKLKKGDSATGATVWAVVYPMGPAYQTETDQMGRFSFSGLDITSYLLVAKGKNSNHYSIGMVDLLQDLSPDLEIVLTGESFRMLQVKDERGEAIPFSWLLEENTRQTLVGNPYIGGIPLPENISGSLVGVVTAPGYYAQANKIDADKKSDLDNLALKEMPDNQILSWGEGQIIIPAQTNTMVGQEELEITRGWIWGANPGDEMLTIHTPEGEIGISSGEFSLEINPLGDSWLYVYKGNATFALSGNVERISVEAGQMLWLGENAKPIVMSMELVGGLRTGSQMLPEILSEPGMKAKFRDSLIRLGIGSAQTFTLLAYILVFLAMIGLPIFGIYLKLRRGSKQKNNQEQLESL